VSAREYAELPTDVREFEPVQALVADDDGLAVLERLAGSALAVLAPGGRLYCEIGETQGRRALALFNGLGLERVTVHPDLSGRDRVVSGRRPA
jgi:release factor glutamine methyltransferase